MDRSERFHRIDRLLRARRSVNFRELRDELGISPATLKRDLEYLRDRMGAPIRWDRDLRGYCYDNSPTERPYALPGLWLTSAEILALLSAEHLIESLEPGVLAGILEPLRARLHSLVNSADTSVDEIRKRVRLLPMAARTVVSPQFALIAEAVVRRLRVDLGYRSASADEITQRTVSPQRLVHYRDNWYLDAWCHLRRDLRTFALDRILSADLLDVPAKSISERQLDKKLASGYGIFSGDATHTAILRFTVLRARWVSGEIWHPHQSGSYDEQGRYILTVPYSDPRELAMDILRHGSGVEVLEPASLRTSVRMELEQALLQYQCGAQAQAMSP